MRSSRFFVDLPLYEGQRVILPAGPSRHLTQVLRLRPGDPLVLFNGDGRDFDASLLVPARDAAQVEVGNPGGVEAPPALMLHLGIGISKGERMDLTIQKAVELGVTRISPLFTRRSVVRLDESRLQKRQQHWRGVLVAACEQSGRRRLPELSDAASPAHWLTQAHPCPLLLDHRSETPLPEIPTPPGTLTILVGPEGGLAPDEREQAITAGFAAVRLGPRVMRTETAPLAALAAAQAIWGDFRS